MKGLLIRLDHVTVVPIDQPDSYGWTCVVVESDHPQYPVGGYNLFISNNELTSGTAIPATRLRHD